MGERLGRPLKVVKRYASSSISCTDSNLRSTTQVLLAKAYSLTFKGAVYHFETGTKVMIHKRSTRMVCKFVT